MIESPGYPHGYGAVQTCIWYISVNAGFKVHIHFDPRFDVTRTPSCRDEYVLISTRRQRFNDFHIVRNGPDSVVFCGNQKPSNVTSPSNEMWIRFKSKAGGRRGFRAWYGAEGESDFVKQDDNKVLSYSFERKHHSYLGYCKEQEDSGLNKVRYQT